MLDNYSALPLWVIYLIGAVILAAIAWSLIKSAAEAGRDTRKRLLVIYTAVMVGCVILVWGIGYFKVSERLFPAFYEHEELRQKLNEPPSWDQDYKLEGWQKPF